MMPRVVVRTVAQMTSASCSTQPEAGYCCSNACCSLAIRLPSGAKAIARLELVPWSIARMIPLVAEFSGMRCSPLLEAVMLLHRSRPRIILAQGNLMLAVVMSALAITATGAPEVPTPPATGVMHQYAWVDLSPDGRRIASVETVRQPYATSEQHGAVVIRDTAGTILARLDTCRKCKYSGLSWAAESKRLGFGAGADGGATLYGAMPRPSGAVADSAHPYVVYKIAELKGLLATPRWSPQGNSIAVLATAGAHKETGAVEAGAREVGEVGS